jgi:hypothetical protein
VLRGGHATYILVESVEKPTDNRLVSLLRCGAMDADSFRNDQPVVAPGAFPHTPPYAPGAAATSTEVPGPRAEGRDRTFATRPKSPDKGHHEGDRGRERMSYRVEPYAVRITQSRSGTGWAKKWPSIGMLLEASQSAHWGRKSYTE